jgi:hypothetical protein
LPTEPTPNALASSQEGELSRTAGVRDVIRLLVKTQKAHRLYEGRNAVSEKLESELFERLSRFVSEDGEIHLAVQESELRYEDEVVYEAGDPQDRNDSLPFLLYRDGIRRLSFGPGLEPAELRAFLSCLNRVALLTNEQDDLVTLLWEQDLQAIRYLAVEELSSQDPYPRLQDQLRAGESAVEGTCGAEAVTLDLEQPVSSVPVEACRLEPGEIESLQVELASEEKAPFRVLVSELALELALLEDSQAEHEELKRNLIDIADRLIDDGELSELTGLHEHLVGLASMALAKEPAVEALSSELTRALAEPGRMDRFLARVELAHAPKPDALGVFLARLGPETAPALLDWMGRFSTPAYRRAVTGALLYFPDGGLEALRSSLPLGPAPSEAQERVRHRQFVREVIHALGRHPSERALPPLESLLGASDPETRRESFIALSRYPDERITTLCLDRMADPDPEVRSAALDTLVRRGASAHGLEILDRSLRDARFDERGLNEKRRLFAAVAKLAGESALESFRRLLWGREEHWFASSKDRQFAEAVAHGLRVIGTSEALRLLRECAESGPRFARSACLKEIGPKG